MVLIAVGQAHFRVQSTLSGNKYYLLHSHRHKGGGQAVTLTEELLTANILDFTQSPRPPVRQVAVILRRRNSYKDVVFFYWHNGIAWLEGGWGSGQWPVNNSPFCPLEVQNQLINNTQKTWRLSQTKSFITNKFSNGSRLDQLHPKLNPFTLARRWDLIVFPHRARAGPRDQVNSVLGISGFNKESQKGLSLWSIR